jgi:hypothetical protein
MRKTKPFVMPKGGLGRLPTEQELIREWERRAAESHDEVSVGRMLARVATDHLWVLGELSMTSKGRALIIGYLKAQYLAAYRKLDAIVDESLANQRSARRRTRSRRSK